jgi:hypothetical protein
MPRPEYVDYSIARELLKPTINIYDLLPGQQLDIVLAEGDDCSQQARLRLQLTELPTKISMSRFKVVSADLDPEILCKNQEAGVNHPEIMGGELLVDFCATYRPGYMPPFTLAQQDVLSAGRHLYGYMPNPTDDNPDGGFHYHAEILKLELID